MPHFTRTPIICSAFVALAIARVAAAEPSALPSSPAANPIAIAAGCSYKTIHSGLGIGNVETVSGHGYNFFTVTFTNGAAIAANEIDFQIDFGKASRIVIPDVGTFAPSVTTTTIFRDRGKGMIFSARPTPNDGSVICTAIATKFTDGTSYTAPVAPAPAATTTATAKP